MINIIRKLIALPFSILGAIFLFPAILFMLLGSFINRGEEGTVVKVEELGEYLSTMRDTH